MSDSTTTVTDQHDEQTIIAAYNCLDDERRRQLLEHAREQLDEQRAEIRQACPSWCVSKHDRLTTTCWSEGQRIETADKDVSVEVGPVRDAGEPAQVLLFIQGLMDGNAYLSPEQARQVISATEAAIEQVEQG